MQDKTEQAIIALNEKINELIDATKAIQEKQNTLQQMWDRRHGVVMQRFSKMQEFHEIADMANQVFEKRLQQLEKAVYERKP